MLRLTLVLIGMYSLVQDETECKSLFGTTIYTQRRIYGFSVKVIDVIFPENRFFGHVSYNLELKASFICLMSWAVKGVCWAQKSG